MDDRRLGLAIRALRRRRGWRQADLAAAASVSQPWVSRIEAGRVDCITVGTLRRVLLALDATLTVSAGWRGAGLDRLLDERHAALVEACVRLLRRLGWRADVEVSYSRFGERGSIDILAVRPGAGIALVVEIKSELVAVEGTLRPMDAKTRLAPSIVFDRFGWRPLVVGRLLVLPDISTSRRRVLSHAHTLESALPRRGPAVARWLRQPDGQFAGLLFLPAIHLSDGRGNPSARKRVIGSPMRQAERGKRSATAAAEPVRGGNARQTSSEISRVNG